MEKIILIGGGGHCASIIDTMRQQALFEPVGVLDTLDKVGSNILDVPIVGVDSDLEDWFNKGVRYAFVSIGSVGDTKLRQKLVAYAEKIGMTLPSIIDPSAMISKYADIQEGTFIGKGVIINAQAEIGKQAIINSGVILEHDCSIGDYVHLAPGVTISGNVNVGNYSHIGTNSTLIQCVTVGKNVLIGAGSVVIGDISDDSKAFGNPCKEVVK